MILSFETLRNSNLHKKLFIDYDSLAELFFTSGLLA